MHLLKLTDKSENRSDRSWTNYWQPDGGSCKNTCCFADSTPAYTLHICLLHCKCR